MPETLALKLLGFLKGHWTTILSILGTLGLLFVLTQKQQEIDALKLANGALLESNGSLKDRIASDKALLDQRDALIAAQNKGVEALATAAAANRRDYEVRIVTADTSAKTDEARAAELLKLTAPDNECQSALDLIRKETAE